MTIKMQQHNHHILLYRLHATLCVIPIIFLYILVFQNLHSRSKYNSASNDCSQSQVIINFNLDKNTQPEKQVRNFSCIDRQFKTEYILHGKYWILYDFIPSDLKFKCDQSITYAAPADLNYLDNLIPLVNRWQGPVSISLYAPGTDFQITISRILYLRQCTSPLIKQLVTFHIIFESHHFPKDFSTPNLTAPVECNQTDPFKWIGVTYRKLNGLMFPLGLARNVAKDRSTTYYILNSDVEQYPNPGFINEFLGLVKKQSSNNSGRKVYVLPHFEVNKTVSIDQLPKNKTELQALLKAKLAISFHDKVCDFCHRAPFLMQWIKDSERPGLRVFKVGRRESFFGAWEPFFVGTSDEPEFDERFTWEGNKDKRIQGYMMCLLKYEYHILDNAFLIHRPGIKTAKNKSSRPINSQNRQLQLFIKPEIHKLYGKRPECIV